LEWAKEGKIGKQVDNEKAFDDFNKYVSDRIFDYADKNGYLKDSYNNFMVNDEILTDVQNLLNGKRIGNDFYSLYSPEGRELVRDISRAANNLPTDYFEVKATRPLGLNEFSGAILPNDYADEQVLKALEEAGVPIMGNYDPSNYDESLGQVLRDITKDKNRFKTPYMLGTAGLLGGGSILGALLGGNGDERRA
jgi:predicted component of type VI protein secretion system